MWDENAGRILVPQGSTLWSLTLSPSPTWSSTPIGGTPPGLFNGDRAVFDAKGNRVLVFGGLKFNGTIDVAVNEVWELSLGAAPVWHKLSPGGPQAPAPRYFAGVVLDALGQRLIVFGGGDLNGTQFNDVYQLSIKSKNGTWKRLIANGAPGSPTPRERHSVIVDTARRRMVVFGGVGPNGMTNDVWALSLTAASPTWQSIATSGAPSPRDQNAAIYDVANDRMVIHGGYDNVNGPLSDAAALPFAGPATWTSLPSRSLANAGYAHTAVYDGAGGRMIIPFYSETHALALGVSPAWSFIEQHVLPRTQLGGAIASDTRTFVIAGGVNSFGANPQETWMLDLSGTNATWVRADLSGDPQRRAQMAMVWDPPRARMLAFGGSDDASRRFNDVWSFTLAPPAWASVATGGTTPSPGFGWRGVYDPSGDRLVFFAFDEVDFFQCTPAGCRQPSYTNSIFELPLSGPAALQWTRHDVLPAGFHMRQGASFSYDAARDVAWLYGGQDSTFTSLGDVWQVNLAGVPVVTPVTTSGTPPEARQFHAATFDAAGDRLIVFGGQVADGTPRNDTWALEAGAGNAWVALAPAGTLPAARFHMASAFDAAGNRLVVFGGSGLSILYDDTWALTLTGPSPQVKADQRGPEARVATARNDDLQLAPAGPPFARGDLAVQVTLPGPGAATLELFDVGGRLTRRVRMDGMSSGTHTVRLAGRGELGAGIYFARLRRAAAERRLRLVVIP